MRILLAAYYKPGIKAIDYLLNNDYSREQIGLLTYNSQQNCELINYAEEQKIQINTGNIKEQTTQKWISEFNPDIIFSLYYRDIIPKNILNIPEYGSINLHPSLLPKYKGCFSAPWAIIDGEKFTGFTYHYMIEDVDAGNIIYQQKVKIENEDTAYSLYHKLIEEGMAAFPTVLNLVKKKYTGKTHVGNASYYPRKVPFDGLINPSWDREHIKRFIRAMYFPPFPGAAIKINDEIIQIDSIEKYDIIMQDRRMRLE